MNKLLIIPFTLFLILFSSLSLFADKTIIYSIPNSVTPLNGQQIEILEDKKNKLTITEVLKSPDFFYSTETVPNFQISKSTYWTKFKIKNTTSVEAILLVLEYPIIDNIHLYSILPNNEYTLIKSGENIPISNRIHKHQNYIFNLTIPKNTTQEFILKVSGSEQMQLPLIMGAPETILEYIFTKDLIFGVYAGIILVMFLYNIFIYFSVKDISYLYYVGYIITVGITQACLQGYTYKFLWSGMSFLSNQSMVIFPSLAGIGALLFVNNFLRVKYHTPKSYKYIIIIIGLYCVALFAGFFQLYHEAQNIVQLCALVGSLLVFSISLKIMNKGNQEAKLFLIAWSIFLISVIIFVLRNFNILPYNNITYYALQIGSAIEVILLSLALANRINILKKEKEKSDITTFKTLQENERIIREQNIILEGKVAERTTKLEETILNLKQTQSKLVDAEKMASLGQLTAGIAHELNNPINFVISSIQPLRRDLNDIDELIKKYEKIDSKSNLPEAFAKIENFKKEIEYDYLKTEINTLLKGIDEGANRTSEIVKGLRIFSRIDEADLKKINITEGIDSTLALLNSKIIDTNVSVIKNYAELPPIECFPGKLNQVFMNILNNAIQAIEQRPEQNPKGEIKVSTSIRDENIVLSFEDNGIGMNLDTIKKVFEPFYTTKDVGKGTGLGMSISKSIIDDHNGTIEIKSEVNKGTTFHLQLPINQPKKEA